MPVIACPSQADLSAYLLGSLPEGQSESLEQHAETCLRDIVYVVETDEGQRTLTPAEFAEKYGWKNDPERVTLSTPTAGAK